MLDRAMRKLIDPPLNLVGVALAKRGVTANSVTLFGLLMAPLAAVSISFGGFGIGLVFIALSRIADGLDGAVARASQKSDFGGYLDIASDFFFYGVVPFAFIVADPAMNALPGAFLLLAFYVNGASFLGYAILAEKNGLKADVHGVKSLYYSNGLLEGSETIILFAAICFWPVLFPILAWSFGALCFVTASLRVLGAHKAFGTVTINEEKV